MATSTSVITQITGQAWIREADGTMTPIHQGMQIPADANIVTAEGASVQLQANGQAPVTIGENRDMRAGAEIAQADVDPAVNAAVPADPQAAQVLAALDAGDDPFDVLDPTAAVLTGGADGAGGSSFTRLMSIVETTSPLGLEYPRPSFPGIEDVRLGGTGAAGDDAEVPAAPTLLIPDFNGVEAGHITISEDAGAEPVGSTFAVIAPAGLFSLTISGQTISAAQLAGLEPGAEIIIDTPRGSITLTGYDPATGTVSYEYRVKGAQDHSEGEVNDDIEIIVTDILGRSVSDTLGVSITDTAPGAKPDTAEVTEDTQSEASGNVITDAAGADQLGADYTKVIGIIKGKADSTQSIAGQLDDKVPGDFGSIEIDADGNYTYTLHNDDPRVDSLPAGGMLEDVFTYTIRDADGDFSTTTITVFIHGTNDAPILVPEVTLDDQFSQDAQAIAPVDISVQFDDVDTGDVLSFTATGLPDGLTLDPATGIISGTLDRSASQGGPAGDGVYTVVVTATDVEGAWVTQTFTWDVTNPAPVAVADVGTTDEDTVLSVDALNGVLHNDRDPDGDPLVVSAVNGAATHVGDEVPGSHGGVFILHEDGSYTFKPGSDFQSLGVDQSATTSITYTVSDGEGGTHTATLTITVTGTNDAPILVPEVTLDNQSSQDAQAIAPVDISVQFKDVDAGDVLTFTATGLPEGLTLDSTTGIITGTLPGSASQGGVANNGVYTVVVTATDKAGESVTQTFEWNVANPEPTAVNDTGSTDEDTVLTVNASNGVLHNDTDPDGDALAVSEVDGVATNVGSEVAGSNGGVFILNEDGSYTFKPGLDFQALGVGDTAETSVTYTVSDGEGGTDTATLTITVTGTNDVPEFKVDASALAVAVTEEALPGVGLLENEDTIREKSAIGKIVFSDPDAGDTHEARLSDPTESVSMTSNGQPVKWDLSEDGQTLRGYIEVDGTQVQTDILIVSLGERTGADGQYEFGYTVTLKGPVDHPVFPGADDKNPEGVDGIEDALPFDVGVTITDGKSEPINTQINITIYDDSPSVGEAGKSATVVPSDTSDVLNGSFSFAGTGTAKHDTITFGNNETGQITVTGRGFKGANTPELIDAAIGQNSDGIGVASTGSPYHNIDAEVDYRIFADGTHLSEELIIDLQDGMVAYGAKISFAAMYGGEDEVGKALFYKKNADGGYDLVDTQTFTSTEASGNYAADFAVLSTAFDRIVLVATNNGAAASTNDNSDFTVAGIEFYGAATEPVIASAEGELGALYGADGRGDKGGISITAITDNLVTEDGVTVTAEYNKNGVYEGRDTNDKLVFELHLNQSTGAWELRQFQKFGVDAESDALDLAFTYQITDADGDTAVGTFGVKPLSGVLNAAPNVEDAKQTVDEGGNIVVTGTLQIDDDKPEHITVQLGLPNEAEGYQDITSMGTVIEWTFADGDGGQELVGKAGTQEIIKVTINDTGDYTVTMLGPIDHDKPNEGDNHDSLGFVVPVVVQDGDHTVPTTLTVTVKDGEPSVITDAETNVSVVNVSGASQEGSLGINVGTDVDGATAQITDAAGESLAGKPVTATVLIDGVETPVPLTSGGVALKYMLNDDGSVTAVKVDDANTPVFTVIPNFTVTPNVTTGKYTVTMHGIIDPITTGGPVESTLDITKDGKGVDVEVDAPFSVTLTAHGEDNNSNSNPYIKDGHLGVGQGGGNGGSVENNPHVKISGNEALVFKFSPTQIDATITKVVFGTAFMDSKGAGQATIQVNGTPVTNQGGDSLIIENLDGITEIVLGAAGFNGNGAHGYSITSVQLFYETGASEIVTHSEFTLNLGVEVMDGDGDTATNTLPITINSLVPVTLESVDTVIEGEGYDVVAKVGSPVAGSDLIIELSNGETITIPVGEREGRVSVCTRGDDIYKQDDDAQTITITGTSGGNDKLDVSSATTTTTVMDDNDHTFVTVTTRVTKTSEITIDNLESDSFKVTATDAWGRPGNISIVEGTDHDGFGVSGANSGSADERELGYGYVVREWGRDVVKGQSEKISIAFNHEVTSFDVQFAWRNNQERAKVEFFDGDKSVGYAVVSGGGSDVEAKVEYFNAAGKIVSTESAKGGSDQVDLAYTFYPSGATFNRAEFSAVGKDDDYLIHSVKYGEVLDTPPVSGEKYEMTVEVKTSNKPDPGEYEFKGEDFPIALIAMGGKTHEIKLNADGVGTVKVTPDGTTDMTPKVIAIDGNFEWVTRDAEGEETLHAADAAKVGDTGDDILVGTDGDDVLFGGAGDDTLTGGKGNDLFIWNAGDQGVGIGNEAATDTITDFGAEGTDTLDISGLLSNSGDGSLDGYLAVIDEGGKMAIALSTQGTVGDGSGANQKIVLDNIAFDEHKAKEIADSLKADGTFTTSDGFTS